MYDCWSDGEDSYVLPGDCGDPKVVWRIRRKGLNNDDWMMVQAAMARLRVTMSGQGRELDDPLIIAKTNGIEREAMVKVIASIENVHGPGDKVDRPEEILELLKALPFGFYQTLVAHVIGTQRLTPIERKPSGSPSEGGQPSQMQNDSETGRHPTA